MASGEKIIFTFPSILPLNILKQIQPISQADVIEGGYSFLPQSKLLLFFIYFEIIYHEKFLIFGDSY